MRLRFLAVIVGFVMLGVTSSPLAAAPGEPSAAVSMGDSFIAGEAVGGRATPATTSQTDGARIVPPFGGIGSGDTNRSGIYGSSYSNGCHRSDVAPIRSAELDVEAVFNLACSGASTINLLPAAAGGASYRGELPQIDQLADLARTHAVEIVAISVGGNDLGIQHCGDRLRRSLRHQLPLASQHLQPNSSSQRERRAGAGNDQRRPNPRRNSSSAR